jgi:hypothetical protein
MGVRSTKRDRVSGELKIFLTGEEKFFLLLKNEK